MTEEHDTALIASQLADLTRVVEGMATQLKEAAIAVTAINSVQIPIRAPTVSKTPAQDVFAPAAR
jgi:hypothetical protein